MKKMNFKQYRGWIRQIPIYVGKFFRMFINIGDWKVVAMAALIAGLVSYVIKGSFGINMEGTLKGSLALSCICIWNGFFNSVQVICREREIVKREHRCGMALRAYISAHVIYQAFLCFCQAFVTTGVLYLTRIKLPFKGTVLPLLGMDLLVTLFLITFSADMLALLISAISKTTTAAMTIMPFVLIFELLFSGAVFTLPEGIATSISYLTIARVGMCALCAVVGYNTLPMTTVWKMLKQFENIEYEGETPIKDIVVAMESQNKVDDFCMRMGQESQNLEYATTAENITDQWIALLIFAFIFSLIALICLSHIDKDKR